MGDSYDNALGFNDPDFDGEPVVIYEPGDDDNPISPDADGGADNEDADDEEGGPGKQKIYVSGVPVRIIAEGRGRQGLVFGPHGPQSSSMLAQRHTLGKAGLPLWCDEEDRLRGQESL